MKNEGRREPAFLPQDIANIGARMSKHSGTRLLYLSIAILYLVAAASCNR
ncbi:MAG: hypothetical protein M3R58_00640 [Pseudomonadota bacterium]|nr:hypothetical protein [Pseudomonadota bacterium]